MSEPAPIPDTPKTSKTPGTGRAWQTLKNRADFLAARDGARAHAPAFVLQLKRRHRDTANGETDGPCRIGFTVTRKVGNAVERNRIKRRLRAACDALLPDRFPQGCDCVLIARRDALDVPFAQLVRSLDESLIKAGRHRVAKRTGSGQNP